MTDRRGGRGPKRIGDENQDEESLVSRKENVPRRHNLNIDFIGGLILGVALFTESTLLEWNEHWAQSGVMRLLGVMEILMVFVFFFYRVWTNRPDAGQTVFLFLMIPFILGLSGVGLWGAILTLMEK